MNVYNQYVRTVMRRSFDPTLLDHIQVQKKNFPPYVLFTYTPKTKRNECDDKLFARYPALVSILPRACSILCRMNTSEENRDSVESLNPEHISVSSFKIIGAIMGMQKFTGPPLSEDPEDADLSTSVTETSSTLFNVSDVQAWEDRKQLRVVRMTKENGKFAIMRLMKDPETQQILLLVGSKNSHILTPFSDLSELLDAQNNPSQSAVGLIERTDPMTGEKTTELRPKLTSIVLSILADINEYRKCFSNETKRLFQFMMEGYSLVGELCDGQHFMQGDNSVRWFGLFRHGLSLDPLEALSVLEEAGLKTVDYQTVIPSSEAPSLTLEKIFLSSRCMTSEGSVLYCTNTQTGESVLFKSKSSSYIVKRFMRQVLLRGYACVEDIRNRFVDVADYHGLNTDASIRLTHQLYQFAMWMMNKDLPTTVLSVLPVESVRGTLGHNGFHHYWHAFLTETSAPDIEITESDFEGSFEHVRYLKQTELYPDRDETKAPLVVFVQGLQGSGKSTLGAALKQHVAGSTIVEQDVCYGDTRAAQGQLYHRASDGHHRLILVTRCNLSPDQYVKYLTIAHERGCPVVFIGPRSYDPLYLAVSFAGILQRSTEGDQLMMGRRECPIEQVYDFVFKNYRGGVIHPNAFLFDTHQPHTGLLKEASSTYVNKQRFLQFVKSNKEQLLALRTSCQDKLTHIMSFLSPMLRAPGSFGNSPQLVRPSRVTFVRFVLNLKDKRALRQWVEKEFPIQSDQSQSYTYYCDHVTQHISKEGRPKFTLVPAHQTVMASIDYAIYRESDGSVAFHIRALKTEDGNDVLVDSGVPHLTARLPDGMKPFSAIRLVLEKEQSGMRRVPFSAELELICLYR